MLGQMGVIMVGFVDNIMVGRYGTAELGAASFVNNFVNIAFVLGMGFSYGLTPLVAGSYAVGDGRLKSLLKSSVVANVLVGLVLSAVMGLFLWRLDWLGQPAELTPLIVPYYLVQLVSILPMSVFNAYKQLVDGVEQTRVSMQSILYANVVNVLLNYLLIYGKLGFPELGLLGAGVATFVARLLSLLILLYAVHGTARFGQIFREAKCVGGRVRGDELKRLFGLGLPSGMQMGLESGSFSIAVVMIGWLGTIPLAAHQVANTLSTLGFMMYYGISSAVAIRVGHFYELRDSEGVRRSVRSGLSIHALLAVSLVVMLLLFREEICRLFVTDEAVVALGAQLCLILCLYQPGDVLQILYSNALRGMRDVRFTAGAALFSYAVMTILMGYLLGIRFGMGVVGVWLGFPIGLTTLGVLLLWRYRRVVSRL